MITAHTLSLLMRSHGMTPALLASRANVRQAALESILAGTKEPTTREANGLARALGLDLADFAALPTPQIDGMGEWQDLRERLYQHGRRHGWKGVREYLVVMVNAWGREEARVKMMERRAQ